IWTEGAVHPAVSAQVWPPRSRVTSVPSAASSRLLTASPSKVTVYVPLVAKRALPMESGTALSAQFASSAKTPPDAFAQDTSLRHSTTRHEPENPDADCPIPAMMLPSSETASAEISVHPLRSVS